MNKEDTPKEVAVFAFFFLYNSGEMRIECCRNSSVPENHAAVVIPLGKVPAVLGQVVTLFREEDVLADFSRFVYALALNSPSIEIGGEYRNSARLSEYRRIMEIQVISSGQSLDKIVRDLAEMIRHQLQIKFV